MTFALRRKAPGINTAIATYQPPAQNRPSSSNGSSHRSSRSEASSSRSRSPAQASLASVADENYPASGYLDTAHNEEDYVLAMHDFIPVAPNVQCLSFRAGQVIHVLNRDQTGWWDGELDGRRGWFPSNYVNATATPSPPRPKKVSI
jgi:son of sevenless